MSFLTYPPFHGRWCLDEDAVVILDVFGKKSRRIPEQLIVGCRDRLRRYDAIDQEP